jgi:hypothetical protein
MSKAASVGRFRILKIEDVPLHPSTVPPSAKEVGGPPAKTMGSVWRPFYPPVKLRDTAIANQRTDTALAGMAKFFLALIAIGFVTLIGAFVFAAFTL